MDDLQTPSGHQRITPYFLVNDADAFITCLKTLFDAKDREMHRDDTGMVHYAELTSGDAVVMLGQSTEQWKAGSSMN